MAGGGTLWMGDLEPYMDEIFITQAFIQMGEPVANVKLIKSKTTGLLAGYCFVEFHDVDTAHKAMLRLNGKIVPGSRPFRRFKLNHASYGKEHLAVPEYSLFVGDLTDDVDDLSLYQGFAKKYKSIRAAKVVLDGTGRSKGYGFVRFTDEEEQQRAITEMQHYCGIGKKIIRVSLATPKKHNPPVAPGTSLPPGGSHPYYTQYPQYPYYSQWSGYTGQQYYAVAPSSSASHAYSHYDYAGGWDQSGQYEDEDLEDPCVEVDVQKVNKEFIETSEEFYTALEDSRWNPLDSVMSKVPGKAS
ncbi:tRNA selenocysteine 1-associated protein 1 isoform X2 [Lingula anatina]|uniref:tRNA selenocysteine-associated protein 1 n=1 Tax=Lingula anatina TaxID=7574 RepID=A0A1S3JJN4_LINAN|nr:tRNA selenocysteine 1-associated protein 1 isoform X2 [Lingula anatina]|eukprot:XP_013410625.1 tRNA selenocysteine 1-associated protein 1 isoform X2 [Lingula anatina]